MIALSKIAAFILLLLAGLSSALAQENRVNLRQGLGRLDLSPYINYRIDPDGRADASSQFALIEQGQFKPLPGGKATFGFSKDTYWFHARIFNDGHSEERWLLVLKYPLLDNIDLYLRYPDGRIEHLASGDKLPFSARAIRYRQPNFWLDLPQRTEVELLLRAKSESSMQVPLSLYTFGAFAELERDAQLGIGLYDGILLALFLYNLMLWLSLRDSNHFWYMCHIAGFGLIVFCLNGLAFEYLWPDMPWLANHAIPIGMCLSQIAMHQFTRIFLELRLRWPTGDRISLGFMIGYAVIGIASLWIDYRSAVLLGTIGIFPGILAVLYQAFESIRRGYQPARLFLIAWTILLLGTAMYALVSFGILGKNFITEYGIQIGSATEMILLSFALAHRQATFRKDSERVSRELIEQLEKNVSKRTSELSLALEQLADANSRFRDSTRRDVLTGAFNRRHFHELFEQMLQHCHETREPLALMLIDIDNFKKINDSYGHLAGDECLRAMTRNFETLLADENAVIARFDGGQFSIALSGRTADQALAVAERICQNIRETVIVYAGKQIALTASIGLLCIPSGTSIASEQALHQADDALYAAKNTGRNKVSRAN